MTILGSHDSTRFRALPGQVLDQEAEEQESALGRRLQGVGHSVTTFLGPIVILDFLMGFTLFMVKDEAAAGLPGGIVTGAAMVAVGFCRRATLRVRGGGILVLVAMTMLAYLALESQHNHMPWSQRIIKFTVLFLVAAVIATGRINIRSLVVGAIVGVLLNAVMFYAGLTTNYYPPYLTGHFGDKNIAGMYYALLGILGLLVVPRLMELPWVVASLGLVFLTGSRTSLAALLLAVCWILLRNRIGIAFRLGLVLVGWLVLDFFETNFAQVSAFGDRTGDDWYRQQIEAAMWFKADLTPWYGKGLNQGYVILGEVRREWFHNSYLQAFVEGGYPFLLVTVIVFGVIGMGLLDRKTVIAGQLLRAEAGIIVVMICAWKLGEVFMTLGAFFALGIVLAYRLGDPVTDSDLAWVLEDRPKRNSSAWDAVLAASSPEDADRSDTAPMKGRR